MEIEGMIIRDLGQIEGVSKAGNPWKKHEWVLETFGQYPRKVKFTVFGERSNTVTFELGKSYAVQVDIESREFNDRWYTDVNAFAARQLEAPTGMPGTPGMPGGQPVSQPQFGGAPAAPAFQQPAAPAAPASNPFGPAPDFSQGDSQEDLPF